MTEHTHARVTDEHDGEHTHARFTDVHDGEYARSEESARRYTVIKWNTIIPIIIFVVMQTSVAVWWAGNLNNTVLQIQSELTRIVGEVQRENTRQWVNINGNSQNVNEVVRIVTKTSADVENTEDTLEYLRDEVKETNRILRDKE